MDEPNTHHPFPAAPVIKVPITNPHLCAPHPVDLLIFRRVKEMQHGDFVVTDINTNVIFKLKDESKHYLNSRRVLLDAANTPIITLKPKFFSMHNRWQVFKGESTNATDLLFTAKRSSIAMLQQKTKLDVFLANNTEQKVSDFKVKGSWKERPCLFYAGESSSVVAQMHKKAKVENLFLRRKAMVTVFPEHDYGFIVALIIILAAINEQSGGTGGNGCGGRGGCGGDGGDVSGPDEDDDDIDTGDYDGCGGGGGGCGSGCGGGCGGGEGGC